LGIGLGLNGQDELDLFLGRGNDNCFDLLCPYDYTLGTTLLSIKHPPFWRQLFLWNLGLDFEADSRGKVHDGGGDVLHGCDGDVLLELWKRHRGKLKYQ
jgi:hypothetical protein